MSYHNQTVGGLIGLAEMLEGYTDPEGYLDGRDGERFEETLVFVGSEPQVGLIAAIGLYGDRLRVGFGSLGGWDPFGPDRLITRSEGNVLFELDGKSALGLYKTYLGEYARENGHVEGSLDDIDPSAWERSVLRFSSPEEKRQIENFNKLFGLAVEWPWLRGLVNRLIKLPPNPFFRLVYKLWKGYAIKNRIHPYRPSTREFVQTVRRFMQFD